VSEEVLRSADELRRGYRDDDDRDAV